MLLCKKATCYGGFFCGIPASDYCITRTLHCIGSFSCICSHKMGKPTTKKNQSLSILFTRLLESPTSKQSHTVLL
jgi:hypothetical protein